MAEGSLFAVPGLMGQTKSIMVDIWAGSGIYLLTFFMIS